MTFIMVVLVAEKMDPLKFHQSHIRQSTYHHIKKSESTSAPTSQTTVKVYVGTGECII